MVQNLKELLYIRYVTYDLEKLPSPIFCGNEDFISAIFVEDSSQGVIF